MSSRTITAFVLHRRPWRESSFLFELLTPDQGRIGAIAKGLGGKRATWRQCLQAFRPLQLFVSGRGELATITQAEELEAWSPLVGDALYCGLYLNELVVRLLPRQDAHPEFFRDYRECLLNLYDCAYLGVPLRYAEMSLLSAIGFGLQLEYEANSGQPIQAEQRYRYDVEAGPRRSSAQNAFAGSSLLALACRQLSDVRQRSDARRLLEQALAPHLGTRPMVSKQLMKRRKK